MALTTNLVSYWKFDSSNSNDSVTTNNGTDTSITYGTGIIGNGSVYNGTTSKITLPSVAWGIATNYSLQSWIKTTIITNTNAQIFCNDSPTLSKRIWQFGLAAGTTSQSIRFIRFDSTNTLVTNISGTTQVNDGLWHHVICTFDSAVGSKVYIDGTSNASDAVTTANGNAAAVALFGGIDSGSTSAFWNGTLDEIAIWNRTLSSTEVTSLYNSGAGLQYPFATAISKLALLGVG